MFRKLNRRLRKVAFHISNRGTEKSSRLTCCNGDVHKTPDLPNICSFREQKAGQKGLTHTSVPTKKPWERGWPLYPSCILIPILSRCPALCELLSRTPVLLQIFVDAEDPSSPIACLTQESASAVPKQPLIAIILATSWGNRNGEYVHSYKRKSAV